MTAISLFQTPHEAPGFYPRFLLSYILRAGLRNILLRMQSKSLLLSRWVKCPNLVSLQARFLVKNKNNESKK